jgi:hypothetical protein
MTGWSLYFIWKQRFKEEENSFILKKGLFLSAMGVSLYIDEA